MVIVKIFGGLGNQLFQYLFGQFLASQLGTTVKFDVQTDLVLSNFTPRGLGLSAFDIQLDLASTKDINRMKFFSNGLFEKIERKISQKVPIIRNTYFVESLFHKLIESKYIRDNCYYEGYWQSISYLLVPEIGFNVGMPIVRQLVDSQFDLINEIKTTDSVSLHIRRGDYISIKVNSTIFQVCTLDYYRNAIAFFEEKLVSPQFFVFSDDIEWAKENLCGDNFIFVTGNQPVDDMYLMSLCKHNVIANSTFSWWGAYFNTNEGKIVIAPKQWYVGKLNENIKYLILDKWIQM